MLPTAEATKLLRIHIRAYRTYSYDTLAKMIMDNRAVRETVQTPSGRRYLLRIRVTYHDDETMVIRVSGTLSLPRSEARWWQFWRYFNTVVVADAFFMSPDGTVTDS